MDNSSHYDIDCLLIGYNSVSFSDKVKNLKLLGNNNPFFKDINLAYVDEGEIPSSAMCILNKYATNLSGNPNLNNSDFLWPAITYLGTYLHRRNLNFDYVKNFHSDKSVLKDKLTKKILTVAITTTVYVEPNPVIEIIKFIKKYNTDVKIIVGGPLMASQPQYKNEKQLQQFLNLVGADFYIFSSEGEFTLQQLIHTLKEGKTYKDLPNLAYYDEKPQQSANNYYVNATNVEVNELDKEMVDYTLFNKQDFGEFVSVRTAKSCPYSCAFCGYPARAGKYTYLNVPLVESELNNIKNLGGISTVTFIDDTFNVPKQRFKELLRMMIKNNYGFKWNCYFRSDQADDEVFLLMKEAGCEGVFLGIESGSDEQLKRMAKTARRHDYENAIKRCREMGIITYASLVIGFPGETEQTVNETINFIENSAPDFFRAQCWYADKVTPIFKKQEEFGIKGGGFLWSHNTMDVNKACEIVDRMFMAIKNSIWLPQQEFEFWSLFYLQRKGLTLSQIKKYLTLFNTALRDKFIARNGRNEDYHNLELLREYTSKLGEISLKNNISSECMSTFA